MSRKIIFTNAEIETMKSRYLAGESPHHIAVTRNVHLRVIINMLLASGLSIRPRKRSGQHLEMMFWSKVKRGGEQDCWPWIGRKAGSYGSTRVDGRHIGTHRLAWTLTRGQIPVGMDVCHQCDNPPCCNPAHLFLGTNLNNIADKTAKGRAARMLGMDNATSKLTNDEVKEIRARYRYREYGYRRLSRDFHVNHSVIRHIVMRETWSHI